MDPINWPQIIRALLDSGITQPEIAAQCQCGQSTISELLRGKTVDPRMALGLRVLRLAASRGVPVPLIVQADASNQQGGDRAAA